MISNKKSIKINNSLKCINNNKKIKNKLKQHIQNPLYNHHKNSFIIQQKYQNKKYQIHQNHKVITKKKWNNTFSTIPYKINIYRKKNNH